MSIEENKCEFFNNIKRLRKQQKLSLEMLAEQSGVPLDMLEQLEQNNLPEEMVLSDAIELAAVFHCEVSELF